MVKKYFRVTFVAIILLILLLFILWKTVNSRSFQFFGEIVPRVNTEEKVVALTFDDGPSLKNTKAVLDILSKLGVKATFFVIGSELEKNLELGRDIVNRGHELGNHSYSHTRMVLETPSFIREEIEKTDKLIRQAGYTGDIHFRPPFGKKLFYLPYYLSKNDRKTITWDLEPETYPEIASSSAKIIKYVSDNTKPGSIILLHVMYDSRQESVKSVQGIVEDLQSKGYRFVTVNELLKHAK